MTTAVSPQPTSSYLQEYNGTSLIVATTIIIFLTTFLLCLRLYARTLTTASRGWDEFLLPIAWILIVGLAAILLLSITTGATGYHTEAKPDKLPQNFKLIYVMYWFYVPSSCLSRLSVVILYLRVFISKSARISCWIVAGFLVGYAVATLVAAHVECIPLAYTWDKTIENGWCFDTTLWWRLTNIPNVVADVAIMLLPVETVWNLQASNARKAGIALVFLTGSIGLVASSVRTSQFYTADFGDPAWFMSSLLSWTIVECGMYLCAACLVGLRPLLVKISAWVSLNFLSRATKQGAAKQKRVPADPAVRLGSVRPQAHMRKRDSIDDIERLIGM